MKKFAALCAVAVVGMIAVPALAAPKTYQVTGPVVAMDASTITVQKGSEKWELAVGSAAVPADVKVGSKVKIEYTMTAATITSKDALNVSSKTPASSKTAPSVAKVSTPPSPTPASASTPAMAPASSAKQ